ncbi:MULTISPECIES: NUDIX domain-containing protein [unclassified Cyanobium]|uniref:NUDIX domain-containing protein n=1 Tax=unclassified Cyanobium TaxID=2627006 RepID=UPI0020CF09C5|nr:MULTISPECIES: NUDIX hydrolase [unclassified Cyanobium]MCP9832870.1 NUDIX hydrolase [Cyanobium sp. La Preciosa 7G6]MCP9935620.1 NUDIX hydrolase [Cyanobium sp. Aljojuca 7A6]
MGRWLKRLIARLRLYWLAARLYETWQLLVRPHNHGALVAIWHQGRLLLVQTSYRHGLGLPGGGLERRETARQAAVRELAEELGLGVSAEELLDPWQITETSSRGKNTVTIFTLLAAREPAIHLDGLELVASHWLTTQEALGRPLVIHVRTYLIERG